MSPRHSDPGATVPGAVSARDSGLRRSGGAHPGGRQAGVLALLMFLLAWSTSLSTAEGVESKVSTSPSGRSERWERDGSCLHCHDGIEDMHPIAGLSCVDCHGGDDTTINKLQAHVQPRTDVVRTEEVADLDTDLSYRRFRNPMDLRIADRTCGRCHEEFVNRVHTSLHGTTAGHLSDGYFEMGLVDERGSKYGIFPVPERRSAKTEHGPDSLAQVPKFRDTGPRDELSTHYTDLARKQCMECHLYSSGFAVRGRTGFDGSYRGEGCAACHVEYSIDGRSESADRSIDRFEPGHPRRHAMTVAPPTSTCTSCHWGDASIGLHFRGLSQLPPGAPGGPDIPGTTDSLLNDRFYLDDPALVPPDIHHEKGMHCIDCHTANDLMGDGKLYGQMEYAVEISCQDCHGHYADPANGGKPSLATLETERGTRLEHLSWEGDRVVLTSKVDGQRHPVPQVPHVLDPAEPEYNPKAERAMRPEHGSLECYVCHNSWNVNFLGFHFFRNEALSQMDLLTGRTTPGLVTTQEKVFSTWKSFYAGLNEEGRVAPYLTGFSTMGTVRDESGELILDQEMPVTANGLSGMSMIHHQMHSNRGTARGCIECHRTSSTWGMGSVNFRLARQFAYAADRRGIEVLALNREQLSNSSALGKIVLPDVVDLELICDDLQGHGQFLFATEGRRGVHVIDVRDPRNPTRVAFEATINPRGMALTGDHLVLADGIGGLKIYDVSEPAEIELVGQVATFDAWEVHVQWPWAYVADGVGGLAIFDIGSPEDPKLVGGTRLFEDESTVAQAIDLSLLFQYSRPMAQGDLPLDERTRALNLCAVVDENEGLVLVDVTEPRHPVVLYPRPTRPGGSTRGNGRRPSRASQDVLFRGVELRSHVDLAEAQGGSPTTERDYAYLLYERTGGGGARRSHVRIVDVSNPRGPRRVEQGAGLLLGGSSEMLTMGGFYNTPFLRQIGFVTGDRGVGIGDFTVSGEPEDLGFISALRTSYAICLEEFPLDQMVDDTGRPLKDISHPRSRWLGSEEIRRLLDVDGHVLGTLGDLRQPLAIPGGTARREFARLDSDRNGVLQGKELERAPSTALDRNGDGLVVLSELAPIAGLLGPPTSETDGEAPQRVLNSRVDLDGDLSRLLDGIDPYEYDRNDDTRLDRKETTRAFFDALDLDGNGRLSVAEFSRHPGEARRLRFGGDPAQDLFEDLGGGRDGKMARNRFRLRDEEWEVMDSNGDGAIQLIVRVDATMRRRGDAPPPSEWPTRRGETTALPPSIPLDRVLEVFDDDGDLELSNRELSKRKDLLEEMDRNGDGTVDGRELAARVQLANEQGVEASPDSFLERWDLDGDGEVDEDEMPPGAALRLR